MRMMLKISIPVTEGNGAIKDGTLATIMEKALAQLRPEAAYFTLDNGNRTAFIVFDMTDVKTMPSIAEPFFTGFGARIDMTPVMNADDMRAGLKAIMHAA